MMANNFTSERELKLQTEGVCPASCHLNQGAFTYLSEVTLKKQDFRPGSKGLIELQTLTQQVI